MFLQGRAEEGMEGGFLHVCGDVSDLACVFSHSTEFSPRMWRCFFVLIQIIHARAVFSTYVEMFLAFMLIILLTKSFLHVCGDVSPLRYSH